MKRGRRHQGARQPAGPWRTAETNVALSLALKHHNLGFALQAQGRLDEAVASYRRALALKPDLAAAHGNLGNAFWELERLDDAATSYQQALALKPDLAEAHANLGLVLQAQGEAEAAVASYRRALALRPDPWSPIRTATVLPVIAGSRDALLHARRRLADNLEALLRSDLGPADPRRPLPSPNFYLAYHGMNDRELQQAFASVCLKACPGLAWTAPHCQDRAPREGGRIRVGFMSRYLRHHTVGKLTRGLIDRLSRDRFEVVVFQLPGPSDEMSTVVAQAADRAVRLPGHLSDARRRIAEESLDLLFYPEIGMDPMTYFLAYARLARVQCVTWGHPVTTGIPNVDYFVSSVHLEPEGAEAHYSERLVRLSRLPTYYYTPPAVDRPPDRRRLGLEDDCTLYVCPQSLFKFHPDFDGIVADILRRDRRGHLVLIEGLSENWSRRLRERFARVFPDVVDRVRFVPRLTAPDFLNLLRVADALLDPLHFGAGNSAYEALALGIPIVTWPGPFMRGRVTHACYKQMEVMECVAGSAAQYVELAVRLANDPAWRGHLSERILAGNHAILEDIGAVHEMERFLAEAVGAADPGERS